MAKDNNKNEDEDELSDLNFDEEEQELSDEFDDFDEELFKEIEAENLKDIESERIEEALKEGVEPKEPAEEAPAAEPQIKSPLSLDQLPVSVVVEIGNIPMTMDKLLKIEQGNLLDVTVNPANGVDLTINGKVVAKGELVRIGENLGVRILELG